MRPAKAIASALQFFAVLFFAFASFLFLSLSAVPKLALRVASFVLYNPGGCLLFGLGFSLIAMIFFVSYYRMNRGRFLRLSMAPYSGSVDTTLIQKILEKHFCQTFSEKIVLKDVSVLPNEQLEVAVSTSYTESEFFSLFTHTFETYIQHFLKKELGYEKNIAISVNWRS